MDSVSALYALQNSMMLTPCGPRAVPTGGAGVAWPAGSCTLTSAAIFFFGGISGPLPDLLCVVDPERPARSRSAQRGLGARGGGHACAGIRAQACSAPSAAARRGAAGPPGTGWTCQVYAPAGAGGPASARQDSRGSRSDLGDLVAGVGQILETWLKPSSTGVSRPKIDTSTLSFWVSALISLTVAGRVANGPSMTVTDSPTS